jgi:hypothetical protein
VKKALRKTLWKYQLHEDQDLFDRAYAYIREYYCPTWLPTWEWQRPTHEEVST